MREQLRILTGFPFNPTFRWEGYNGEPDTTAKVYLYFVIGKLFRVVFGLPYGQLPRISLARHLEEYVERIMDTIKKYLTGLGIIGIILLVIILVIGFEAVSAILTTVLYVVIAVFLIVLVIYMYRKAKNRISDGRD